MNGHNSNQDPNPEAAGKSWDSAQLQHLAAQLPAWAQALGFSQIGISGVDLQSAEPGLLAWLEAGFHGGMDYMQRHGLRRARPAELVPGTVRVICVRMDYLPEQTLRPSREPSDWRTQALALQHQPGEAVVSFYARGRDYHKVLRQRLQALADKLAEAAGPLACRVFTDSAPVMEVELAERCGLGWRGKNTLLLSRQGGSMFFLGEFFIDLPLPVTAATSDHCGQCEACLGACPTQAIVAPGRLDARRCISYLTIEHDGPIPLELRPAVGSRVYGCDDCQLVCPWNKYAQATQVADFSPRAAFQSKLPAQGFAGTGHSGLADTSWQRFWSWDETEFLKQTEGMAIRRIGFWRWRRNLAVVAGNALAAWEAQGQGESVAARSVKLALTQALEQAANHQLLTGSDTESEGPRRAEMLAEHLRWALAQAA